MAVTYAIESIPFTKLDLKESQVNGARMKDAIREHKVEDYMQGFVNGDTFPRPVVHKTATGYVILSGNQRCEAIRRLIANGSLPKTTAIEAYVVDATDKLVLEIIARSANVSHGEGDSKDERIQQAMYCVRSLGMAATDAAKAFQVSANVINVHLRADEQRNFLAKAGIEAHHLPVSVIEPLHKLKYDSNVQTRLGALIATHSLPGDRVKSVVATLSKQQTAPQRQQIIRDLEKELAASAHLSNGNHSKELDKVPSRPRRDKVVSLLKRLVAFLETENAGESFKTLEDMQVTSDADIKLVTDLMKKLRYRIGVII